jgi:hypothetical protein
MPSSFKVSEVMTIIRKKLHMSREQNLFLLAQGKHLMKQGQSLQEIFDKHQDEDGFLYIVYAHENTYG